MVVHRLVCLLAIALFCQRVHADVDGLWYDREHNGHGLDLQKAGDNYFSPFYTFADNGEPVWYWIVGQRDAAGTLNTRLQRLRYLGGTPPRLEAVDVGNVVLRFLEPAQVAQCGEGRPRPGAVALADFRFQLNGRTYSWCLETLLPTTKIAESAYGGAWFNGPGDNGWGVDARYFQVAASPQSFHTIYFYDASGEPRWAYANGSGGVAKGPLDVFAARGYCTDCAPQALQAQRIGVLEFSYVAPLNRSPSINQLGVDITYPFGVGGRWLRPLAPATLISDAALMPLVVATSEGLLRGQPRTNGDVLYANIPFAAPPVGALRWRAPQQPAKRNQVRDARTIGGGCMQGPPDGNFGSIVTNLSEDCLQLNVFVPSNPSSNRLPVLFWIHGGGLTQGGALEQVVSDGRLVYDGKSFTDKDVIVVSINYRLGPFGYLAMREFNGEASDQPGAGNYGLLDQIRALQWVHDNIANFGGDPDRVMVFGESAGGVSTCTLLATPQTRGLMHRALIESGNCRKTVAFLDRANGNKPAAFEQGDRIVALMGCASAADKRTCMRSKTAADIITQTKPTIGFGRSGEDFDLVVDNFSLLEAPAAAIAGGRALNIPMLAGVNEDETTSVLPASLKPLTVAAYEAQIRTQFALIAGLVLLQYPASAYPVPWRAYTDINDDISFACPMIRAARDHAATGNAVYTYVYTHVFAGDVNLQGAFHGAELSFVWGPQSRFTDAETALALNMQNRWVAFARSGNPNIPGGANWPTYSAATPLSFQFEVGAPPLINDYRKSYCDFWARYISL
jgi:para-nitrobenzyl esterase